MALHFDIVEALRTYQDMPEPSRSFCLQDILQRALEDYIRFIDGVPRPLEENQRTQYLATMSDVQFDTLKDDIVFEVLSRGGFESCLNYDPISLIERELPSPGKSRPLQTLDSEDLRSLVAEFVCELEHRLPPSYGSQLIKDPVATDEATPNLSTVSTIGTDTTDTTDRGISDGGFHELAITPAYDSHKILNPQLMLRRHRTPTHHQKARKNLIVQDPQLSSQIIEEEEDIVHYVVENSRRENRAHIGRRLSFEDNENTDVSRVVFPHTNRKVQEISGLSAPSNSRPERTVREAPLYARPIFDLVRNSAVYHQRSASRRKRSNTGVVKQNSDASNRSRESSRTFVSAAEGIAKRDSYSSIDSRGSRFTFVTAAAGIPDPDAAYVAQQAVGLPIQASPTEWTTFLDSLSLRPDPMNEFNWSGKGQHVEYHPSQEPNIPLVEGKVLGHTACAVVQSVLCKRIKLARKTIICNRLFRREVAIREVEHLQRLSHYHIVRVVGTYVVQHHLSILLYPATDWNLETFFASILSATSSEAVLKRDHLFTFTRCLVEAVGFLQDSLIKHMDIKPKNLLVEDQRTLSEQNESSSRRLFKIYIADFGIARSYKTSEEVDTSGKTSYTKLYAAPEVVDQAERGFGADIFSLGCVLIEIIATLLETSSLETIHEPLETPLASNMSRECDELRRIRENNADYDDSYQANIVAIQQWLCKIPPLPCNRLGEAFYNTISSMIDIDAVRRPSAAKLLTTAHLPVGCGKCHSGPEAFRASHG